MLALGRALILKPRLILLDEPSIGLAPKIVEEVFKPTWARVPPNRFDRAAVRGAVIDIISLKCYYIQLRGLNTI
ncbi:hypothetical protein CO046_03175 [Candidatus Peregrinibacteria bacterium CG_4_9_14_0_2_um_filter_53_11]|nr:MAG: hypothetical protein CO046_03175 [Candidatus Peregrinibacteria bacterium CG_4_9_14_0_2_um_filter_53_11]